MREQRRTRTHFDPQIIDKGKVRRARRATGTAEAVGTLAQRFKVLGDPTRLRLALVLSTEELCVSDLATVLGVSQSVVSHSLRALRQTGLVRYRREGKIAYYVLADDHIGVMVREAYRHVKEEG